VLKEAPLAYWKRKNGIQQANPDEMRSTWNRPRIASEAGKTGNKIEHCSLWKVVPCPDSNAAHAL